MKEQKDDILLIKNPLVKNLFKDLNIKFIEKNTLTENL